VQVNGKLRDRLEVAAGVSMDEAAELALALPNVQRHLEGKTIRQVIKVPGRLINILVG
jgi:leucyl-tRNA synthetase